MAHDSAAPARVATARDTLTDRYGPQGWDAPGDPVPAPARSLEDEYGPDYWHSPEYHERRNLADLRALPWDQQYARLLLTASQDHIERAYGPDGAAYVKRALASRPAAYHGIREAWGERARKRAAMRMERHRDMLAGRRPLPARTWTGHLAWLLLTFGDREFTTVKVRDVALADGWTAPPDYTVRLGPNWWHGTTSERYDPAAPRCALRLGEDYNRVSREWEPAEDWLAIKPGGTTHGRRRWRVLAEYE